MKFKQYINEKITKREYKEALENDNIIAGCEFEFYIDEENRNGQSLLDLDLIDRLIVRSNEEINDYNNNLNEYNREIENLNERERELEDELENIENKLEELEEKKKEVQTRMESVEEDIDDLNDKGELTDKDRKKLRVLRKSLSHGENQIDEIDINIDDLKAEMDNMEREYRSIENGDALADLEEQYEVYPSVYTFSAFFEILNELESIGLLEGYSDQYYNELFDSMDNDEIDDTDDLLKMFYGFYIDDIIEDSSNNTVITDKEVEELGFPLEVRDFEVIEDASLGDGGVEIVTGKEDISDLINIIKETFEWIDKIGYTDDSCGFHVHMSMGSKYELDPLKLILFVEEGKIYEKFEERINNSYAVGIKKGHFNRIEPFSRADIKKMLRDKKIDSNLEFGKYLGVHLVDLKNNHIEFRYMGGRNYHKKYKDVESVIANYAHWLSIACDPDYKRKEYLKKLNRMVNYYNAIYLYNIIKLYRDDVYKLFKVYHDVPVKDLKRMAENIIKPYYKSFNTLPKLKKYDIGNSKLFDAIISRSKELVKEFQQEVFK